MKQPNKKLVIPDGPWSKEPNELYLDYENYKICLFRGPLHAWCGYVLIPNEHCLYGKGYSDKIHVSKEILERTIDINKISIVGLLSLTDINSSIDICMAFDVHGGITYAGDSSNLKFGDKFDSKWAFGFDCSHSEDLIPLTMNYGHYNNDAYRDLEYVKSEALSLAKQMKEYDNWYKNRPKNEHLFSILNEKINNYPDKEIVDLLSIFRNKLELLEQIEQENHVLIQNSRDFHG